MILAGLSNIKYYKNESQTSKDAVPAFREWAWCINLAAGAIRLILRMRINVRISRMGVSSLIGEISFNKSET